MNMLKPASLAIGLCVVNAGPGDERRAGLPRTVKPFGRLW